MLYQDKSSVTFLLLNFQNFILSTFEETNVHQVLMLYLLLAWLDGPVHL